MSFNYTPPLLPPPPRSTHGSRSPTPKTTPTFPPQPFMHDLLSSSPPKWSKTGQESGQEPLFPETFGIHPVRASGSGSRSSGPNTNQVNLNELDHHFNEDPGDTSFGSFTNAQVHQGYTQGRQASGDPLFHTRLGEGEQDLLGSFSEPDPPLGSSSGGRDTRAAGGAANPVKSLLSDQPLHPIPSLIDSQWATKGNFGSVGVQGGGRGDRDLLSEIDRFLAVEGTGGYNTTTSNNNKGIGDSIDPFASFTSPSASASTSTAHQRPLPHPHLPPRRLSNIPQNPSGASSPPSVSPISSFSFRGRRKHQSGDDPIDASGTAGAGADFEGFDDFGNWEGAGPSDLGASGSGTPSAQAQAGQSGRQMGEADRSSVSVGSPFKETMDRMRRLSFSRSTGGGFVSGAVGAFPVKKDDGTRRRSSGAGMEGEKGEYDVGKVEAGYRDRYGDEDHLGQGRLHEEPGAYDAGVKSDDVTPQRPTTTLISEGTKRMTGLVHALGSLAAKTTTAATAAATSPSKPKSKWRTVMGPSTFTPPSSGSRNGPYAYASQTQPGTPHGRIGSGDSFGSTWGRSNSGPIPRLSSDDFGDFDRPTMNAQPIEITHHTPFNLGSSTQQTVYIPGTNTVIHPSGAYYASPPTGAPGFRPGDSGWEGSMMGDDRTKRRDDWSGTKLLGRKEGTVEVMDEHVADALRPSLPARQRLSNKWTLLFSLDQHGGSLSTFYRLIETYALKHPHAGNLLIIKDENDRRFGVYMNEWIKRVEGTYTGSGESWLYKIVGDDLDVRAKVFKWTGRNTYFALCESEFISFGGGDGKYGLWVDKVFQNGSSATSPAYANEVLCSTNGGAEERMKFDCMALEVWATSN